MKTLLLLTMLASHTTLGMTYTPDIFTKNMSPEYNFDAGRSILTQQDDDQDQSSKDKISCAPAEEVLTKMQSNGFKTAFVGGIHTDISVSILLDADNNWVQLLLISKQGKNIACLVGSGTNGVVQKIAP